jgi:drug/metabolite transporter (DMT)-like permease
MFKAGIHLKLVLVMLFWAGGFIATRVAAQHFKPFTGASIRYLVACALLVPLAASLQKDFWRPGRKKLLQYALLGFSGIFAYNFFFFRGLELVPASHGALITALSPLMVMLFSAWRYGEKLHARSLVGLALAMVGVVVVVSRGDPRSLLSGLHLGDAFMLGCPVTWAVYTLAGKEYLKTSSPITATAWASITGCLMLLAFSLFEPSPVNVPAEAVWALVYLGVIGTVLAFIWYYQGVVKIGATRTAVFSNLIPVFAMLLSVLILKEDVEPYSYVGAALVIGGVVMTNRR